MNVISIIEPTGRINENCLLIADVPFQIIQGFLCGVMEEGFELLGVWHKQCRRDRWQDDEDWKCGWDGVVEVRFIGISDRSSGVTARGSQGGRRVYCSSKHLDEGRVLMGEVIDEGGQVVFAVRL